MLVADRDEGGEREATAALDDLGHAVDLDDPLLQVEARDDVTICLGYILFIAVAPVKACRSVSELQPALARPVGEGLNGAVVAISPRSKTQALDAAASARSAIGFAAFWLAGLGVELARSALTPDWPPPGCRRCRRR